MCEPINTKEMDIKEVDIIEVDIKKVDIKKVYADNNYNNEYNCFICNKNGKMYSK